jgi:cytochrome c553
MADYKQRSQEYAQKLKDPRWQKKRLEILERDEWTCQLCGSTTDTLAVHHKRYLIDTEPWDYPNKLLITLCETCHEAEKEGGESNDLIAMVKEKFLSNDIGILADGFRQIEATKQYELWMIAETIRWILSDKEIQKKLTDRCWEMMNGVAEKRG